MKTVCVCVCVLCSIELLSKPAKAFIGFGGECHCGNNKTPLRFFLLDSTDESVQFFVFLIDLSHDE